MILGKQRWQLTGSGRIDELGRTNSAKLLYTLRQQRIGVLHALLDTLGHLCEEKRQVQQLSQLWFKEIVS